MNYELSPPEADPPLAEIKNKAQGGYIALMSAIIISIILVGLSFTISTSGYFARFNSLDTELKRVSKGLAESCANVALLKIAQDPSYPGNQDIIVGANQCHIDTIVYNPPNKSDNTADYINNKRVASISTESHYPAQSGSFSTMDVSANIQNPDIVTVIPTTLVATVIVPAGASVPQVSIDGTTTLNSGQQTSIQSGQSHSVTVVSAPTGPDTYTTSGWWCNGTAGNSFTPTAGTSNQCYISYTIQPTSANLTIIANINPAGASTVLKITDTTANTAPQTVTSGQATAVAFNHAFSVTATTPSGYQASPWSGVCNSSTGNIPSSAITQANGNNYNCVINFTQPNTSCADTVMMLDRTASMFGYPNYPAGYQQWVPDEQNAAESLLDLYGKLATPPLAGVGRFGNNSGVSADIIGSLTSSYGSRATTSNTSFIFPTSTTTTASVNQWTSPANGFVSDGVFTTDSKSGDKQQYKNFNFNTGSTSNVPGGASITGIEVDLGAKTSAQATNTPNLQPVSVGTSNNWTGNPTNTSAAKPGQVTSNDLDSTYISLSNINGNGAQTFVMASPATQVPTGSTINSVTLYVVADKTNAVGTPHIKLLAEKSSNQILGPDITLNSTTYPSPASNYFSYSFATMPGGAAWTPAEINAWTTRFGVIKTTSSGTAKVTQLYVVVNYTPPSSLTVALSGNNGANWSATPQQTSDLTGSSAIYVLGGSNNNWGGPGSGSWGSGSFSNANFLLQITNNAQTNTLQSLDFVSVKVYYSVPSSGLYAAIENNLNNVTSWTNLGDAIHAGATELGRINDGKAKVLILISDGTNVNLDATNAKTSGGATTQSAMNYAKSVADNAKTGSGGVPKVAIYTIHFGNAGADGPYNPAPRDFIAGLANGSYAIAGHQPGSQNNAGTSNTQSVVDAENNDHDNFYISPTSAQMAGIFTDIGNAVCPALAAASQGGLIVTSQVIKTNGRTNTATDFPVTLNPGNIASNPAAALSSDGNSMTYTYTGLTPGNFNLSETQPSGGLFFPPDFEPPLCKNTFSIAAGQTQSCTIINYDTPPAPPPPPPPPPPQPVNPTGWQENPN